MSKNIGIVCYNTGNIGSIIKLIKKFNHYKIILVKNKKDFNACERIILPGVGSFGVAMNFLREKKLINVIKKFIKGGGHTLAICLGMQLLFSKSEEASGVDGLGLFKKSVKKIKFQKKFTVPHIGWNSIYNIPSKNMFLKILNKKKLYFSHSYAIENLAINQNKKGIYVKYGSKKFLAMLQYKNLIATQFHPELSGKLGQLFFKIFLND